jgi:hypothetical protein
MNITAEQMYRVLIEQLALHLYHNECAAENMLPDRWHDPDDPEEAVCEEDKEEYRTLARRLCDTP